jgi:putative IMPACT (imprinted ancient) family translation regulator
LQGKLEHFLEEQKIATIDTQYTDKVALKIVLNTPEYEEKTALINDFLNAQATIDKGPQVYHELPYDLGNKNARY